MWRVPCCLQVVRRTNSSGTPRMRSLRGCCGHLSFAPCGRSTPRSPIATRPPTFARKASCRMGLAASSTSGGSARLRGRWSQLPRPRAPTFAVTSRAVSAGPGRSLRHPIAAPIWFGVLQRLRIGGDGGSRTLTGGGLSALPLPIGLRPRGGTGGHEGGHRLQLQVPRPPDLVFHRPAPGPRPEHPGRPGQIVPLRPASR